MQISCSLSRQAGWTQVTSRQPGNTKLQCRGPHHSPRLRQAWCGECNFTQTDVNIIIVRPQLTHDPEIGLNAVSSASCRDYCSCAGGAS